MIHTENSIDLIPANKRLADAAARLQVMQLSQYNTAEPVFQDRNQGGEVTPSGSGSSSSTYPVEVSNKEYGTITVSPKNASAGDTVTVTVKPDSGYVLGSLTVTGSKGDELTLTDLGDGRYCFTMPARRVEVKASFVKTVEVSPFADVID